MIKMSRRVLCLDWDYQSLRLVVARVGKGRMVLEDAHSHRLPKDVDAEDPRALGDFIHSMMRRHKLTHKSVVVDVPRERAVINRLSLPPTPEAEVAAAVRFQAMKELPFPLDTAAVDYVIVERNERGLVTEVLLAAVTTETLERVRATCAAAGLTPARIGLRPYANLISVRCVMGESDKRVLFIDVGPGATEIDVMHGDGLAFARSANVNVPVPVAGSPEDSRIISIAEIADLDCADEAIEAAVGELLVEVTRTLQAYRATEIDARIDEVVVAGGTGIETHLVERMHQRLGYPVTLFDATEALGVGTSEAGKLRSFSAALGLAWGLSREGLLALDFLNPKRPAPPGEALKKRVRLIGMAAAIIVLASGGLIGKRYKQQADALAELKADNSALKNDVEAKLEIQNHIDEVQEWAAEAVWPDELLAIGRLALEQGGHAGEKMVYQELTLDAISRSPGVTIRNLFVADGNLPQSFVQSINEWERDGRRPFAAGQGTSTDIEDGVMFMGKVEDVWIGLRELQEFRAGEAKRQKQRKKALLNVGQIKGS